MKKIEPIEIEVNEIKPEVKASLRSRIIAGLVFGGITIPCVFLGNWVTFIFVLVLAFISCHEIVKAPTKNEEYKHRSIIYVFSFLTVIISLLWIFFKNNVNAIQSGITQSFSMELGFDKPQLSLSGFCVTAVFFFLMVVLDKNFKIDDAFYFIVMLFVISIGYQCMLYLRYAPFNDAKVFYKESTPFFKYFQSSLLIIFVVLGTLMNDTGAYFIGLLFGKHHMTSLSPKKTWEGFFGGIIFSFIFNCCFMFIFSACGMPLLSFLNGEHWYNVLIIALVIPFLSVLGDLVFSAVKRHFGIKDYGSILLSMGGILDRMDSILFSAGGVSLLLLLMSHNWGLLL